MFINWRLIIPFFLLVVFLLNSCATLKEIAKVQKPRVKVDDVKITGLDFNQIHLNVKLKIKNPNIFAVKLPGFGYEFLLEGNSLIKGEKDEIVDIVAQGQSFVDVPLTLTYKDLYNSIKILKSKDSASYKIVFDLYFELPILGKTPLKIEKEGALPLLKLPEFKITSLKLKKLSFTSAKLELNIKMFNPNKFKLFINNFNYNFNVNGLKWIEGISQKEISINENGDFSFKIPVSLNFLEMGRTIYNLISSDKSLNYNFNSDLNLKTSLPMIKEIKLPVNKSGNLKLTK